METILHRIKAYLYDNALTKDNPNDFTARVSSERSLNVQQICESAVQRGGADVSSPAMRHAVELFLKEMSYQLCDGFSINTGYFTASAHIRGVFDSPQERFNPDKHSVLFEFHQGEALRKELTGIEVEILGVAESGLSIAQVIDMKSGSVNDLLTRGRNLKISGQKLKIAGNDESVGIYFHHTQSNVSTKVDASDIVVNNPSELMIVIPELEAGACRLEVKTQFSGSNLLKEPRSTVFDKTLTVQ